MYVIVNYMSVLQPTIVRSQTVALLAKTFCVL